ncbi:MAG: L-aspartate oxidase [Bacteroidales bacterium]|jgi:L-aspartate oxidase
MQTFDFVIVGSGLAGLYAAFRASRYGSVALVTKSKVRDSNSYYAQGGIAAVTDEDDTPAFHFDDTIIAGRGLCDYSAVNILVTEGPERISELVEEGMHFDMSHGSFALGLEGGHHKRRILHAGGDVTGMKITNFMIEKVLSCKNIELFENHSAIEVLTDNGTCCGVRVWNLETNTEELFYGRHTFLTLGGASAIYKRTSNPETTIGDGIALCYTANCELADMEFIQFHPTTIYTPSDKSYLISEAVRGEGAYLINQKGERFMTGIHENAELAPRDIVAQSIYREIFKQDNPYVHLSLKHLNPERIKERFPNIFEKCRQLGIDMTDKIPVAPAAHYMVGGVKTDSYGRTNIKNLYVCGELASTGIMGANRLASNSLIECIVFGHRAVEVAGKDKTNYAPPSFTPKYHIDNDKFEKYLELKERVANIMTRHAGIIRNEELLLKGLSLLEEEKGNLDKDSREYFNLISNNLLIVAGLIMKSAIYRKESRGGHFREDYPLENDTFIHHIIQQKGREPRTLPVITNLR